MRYLGMERGMEIHHDGDLPARSGLGSSSSFTVGFLMALHALNHHMLTKHELADQATEVQQVVIRENVGIQDQIFAAHGGFCAIQIDQTGHYEVEPLILPKEYSEAIEHHVLLGFTGITRYATDLAGVQIKRIESGEAAMH